MAIYIHNILDRLACDYQCLVDNPPPGFWPDVAAYSAEIALPNSEFAPLSRNDPFAALWLLAVPLGRGLALLVERAPRPLAGVERRLLRACLALAFAWTGRDLPAQHAPDPEARPAAPPAAAARARRSLNPGCAARFRGARDFAIDRPSGTSFP